MKKDLIMDICFVLAGILCACFFGYEYFSTYGFLNKYHMQAFANASMDTVTLLGNIIWERGKVIGLVWLLSYTPIRKTIPLIVKCLICFTGGVFLAACILNMGLWGAGFFLLSFMPHGVVYLFVLYLILRVDHYRYYKHSEAGLRRIMGILSVIGLFLFGCILEAVAGVELIRRWMMLMQ